MKGSRFVVPALVIAILAAAGWFVWHESTKEEKQAPPEQAEQAETAAPPAAPADDSALAQAASEHVAGLTEAKPEDEGEGEGESADAGRFVRADQPIRLPAPVPGGGGAGGVAAGEAPAGSGAAPAADPAGASASAASAASAPAASTPGRTEEGETTTTVSELLERLGEEADPSNVYYVHNVSIDDQQGLWGILQNSVTVEFARGIPIRRGGAVETYRGRIPYDADELLDDDSSSLLGLLIHRKSQETIIYNHELGKLTANPDDLTPGHELLIVGFKPEELVELYKYYVRGEGG